MRSSVIWSFLSLVALATGGLVSGCDSDATIAKSGAGESCDSSADCDDGLKCLQGACYKTASPDTGDGGESTGTGGTNVGPTPPVLGGKGESCTKRADCEDGLACFNQRCSEEVTGVGGEGNNPIRLGQLGETCAVSADCDPSLACLPGGQQTGIPVGFVGVCSHPVGSLVPSGKSCGAECVEDTDCCELPIELHIAYGDPPILGASAPYGTGANSCSELAALIGASKCTAAATGALAARCFAQAAYCSCEDTWTCETGKCSYTAACKKDGPVVDGCPNFSRSGIAQVSVCDTETEKCQLAPGDPVCAKDSDCETLSTSDGQGICGKDECICYEKTGCYRACNSSLDCAPGFICDDDSTLCKKAPACTENAECVALMGPRFGCVDETCQMTCASDFDCNGGQANGPNTLICNADGVCEALGCSTNEQCNNGALTPVKMFCTENPTPAPGGVFSAITD